MVIPPPNEASDVPPDAGSGARSSIVARMDAQLIHQLEEHFRRITLLLYDTTVPPSLLDAEVLPFLDESVRFTDPWQQASGREKYRLGAAGFHAMLKFNLEIFQLHVDLDPSNRKGRALVDGVMHLKLLSPLYTFPLRTQLVYGFVLTDSQTSAGPQFLIQEHEEMWSVGDLIAAVPAAGWLYTRLFRKAFSYGFLAASYVSCRARGMLPGDRPREGA
jgi:hypothetical protein